MVKVDLSAPSSFNQDIWRPKKGLFTPNIMHSESKKYPRTRKSNQRISDKHKEHFYRPQMKFSEGNVFTGVSLFAGGVGFSGPMPFLEAMGISGTRSFPRGGYCGGGYVRGWVLTAPQNT